MTDSPILRRARFIDSGSAYHLPRPSSWSGGMARHRWFGRWAGDVPFTIASPASWERLAAQHGVQWLCEHEDGQWSLQPDAQEPSPS